MLPDLEKNSTCDLSTIARAITALTVEYPVDYYCAIMPPHRKPEHSWASFLLDTEFMRYTPAEEGKANVNSSPRTRRSAFGATGMMEDPSGSSEDQGLSEGDESPVSICRHWRVSRETKRDCEGRMKNIKTCPAVMSKARWTTGKIKGMVIFPPRRRRPCDITQTLSLFKAMKVDADVESLLFVLGAVKVLRVTDEA